MPIPYNYFACLYDFLDALVAQSIYLFNIATVATYIVLMSSRSGPTSPVIGIEEETTPNNTDFELLQ